MLGTNGQGHFAYISSGTWSLIGTELNHTIISKESMEADFTNEIGFNSTIRFLKNTMGMFLINEVRNDYKAHGKEVRVIDIVPLVEEAKDVDCYLDVNDPIFETPGNMLSKVEAYVSRTRQTMPATPGEMMKVIYKSMALAYRKIIRSLEELAHIRFASILVVGGGNQARILNQYTASACKIDVITGPSEATVIGNSLAQFISLREIRSVEQGREDISSSIQSEIYRPDSREYWDTEYEKFIRRLNK